MSLFARVGDFKVNNFFVFLSYIKLQRSPPQSYWVCLGDLNYGAVSKARQPSSAARLPGRKENGRGLPGNQTGREGGCKSPLFTAALLKRILNPTWLSPKLGLIEDSLCKPAFSGKRRFGCNPPEMAITVEPLI